jgi:hypothetical protein
MTNPNLCKSCVQKICYWFPGFDPNQSLVASLLGSWIQLLGLSFGPIPSGDNQCWLVIGY